jgi:hypothetical protein
MILNVVGPTLEFSKVGVRLLSLLLFASVETGLGIQEGDKHVVLLIKLQSDALDFLQKPMSNWLPFARHTPHATGFAFIASLHCSPNYSMYICEITDHGTLAFDIVLQFFMPEKCVGLILNVSFQVGKPSPASQFWGASSQQQTVGPYLVGCQLLLTYPSSASRDFAYCRRSDCSVETLEHVAIHLRASCP